VMRIFAGGIATETNTFCAIPTSLGDFLVARGDDAHRESPVGLPADLMRIWETRAQACGEELIVGLMAWAPPAGITIKAAYEGLRDELVRRLRAALPVDIVLLMLHGAMVAEGYESCEQDIIDQVRAVAGCEAIVGVQLDLHCHLSERMLSRADIVLTLKEYPHVDGNDRAVELFDLALSARQQRIRPVMALFDCRMMGFYPTSREPLRSFVDSMIKAEKEGHALSVSFGHGFPFGDVPHEGAKVLVVTDSDREAAARLAARFGRRVHQLRREIGFDFLSVSMEEALTRATARGRKGVVVADQSDNPGGGAPGDSTFVLRWLLDRGTEGVALGILYDPEVVKVALRVPIGTSLRVRLGGKTSRFSGDPVDLEVVVGRSCRNYMIDLHQSSGDAVRFPAGDVVALCHGSLDIVVGTERCQCFSPKVFSDLEIDLRAKQLVIPKSAQHFYEAFAPIASEIIYMAAPGATAPDPRKLSYRRLDTRNLYPWTEDPVLAPSGS
jgi:microcystin degradation protein MlrC